jgi:hypothetical protein
MQRNAGACEREPFVRRYDATMHMYPMLWVALQHTNFSFSGGRSSQSISLSVSQSVCQVGSQSVTQLTNTSKGMRVHRLYAFSLRASCFPDVRQDIISYHVKSIASSNRSCHTITVRAGGAWMTGIIRCDDMISNIWRWRWRWRWKCLNHIMHMQARAHTAVFAFSLAVRSFFVELVLVPL